MHEYVTLMKSELLILVIIFFLLFLKLGKHVSHSKLLPIIQIFLLANFIFGFFGQVNGQAFGNMFFTTEMIAIQKSILNLGVYLISLLFTGWLKRSEHMPEFFILLLSALLGMFFMISAGNMLIFYLALELSTIPVAALANFELHKKQSAEGAMKMIVSSAFSSGFLLFGISLIYGICGSIDFGEITAQLTGSPLEIFAFILVFTGFAFKLSIVPFHLWTADVYQGSPAAVSSFLSVISKGAVAFIFITVLYKVFQPLNHIWYNMLMLLAVITMIIGNLFAMRQDNIKRFLAFSSIAQVGFILVGLTSNSSDGITSVVYFIFIYIFSNLAAFAVASVISQQTGKSSISDLKGLYFTNPFLTWVLALSLFSLAGIPPTAGFFGKLFLITAGASHGNYLFITIAALNLIISLYYYLGVVRMMFGEKTPQSLEKIYIEPASKTGFYVCVAGILFVGLLPWIYDYINALN